MNVILAFVAGSVGSIAFEWANLVWLKIYFSIVRIFGGAHPADWTYNPARVTRIAFALLCGVIAGIAEAEKCWSSHVIILSLLVVNLGAWIWTYYDMTTARNSR